jgi:hypothetical protein
MSLANLLKRSKGGLPSLVTALDRKVLVDTPVYSTRAVHAALALFNSVVKTGRKKDIQAAFDALTKAVNAPRSRDDTMIHVSSLEYACERAMYYRITKAPKTNTPVTQFSPALMRTFAVGQFYHEYIQNDLIELGLLREKEVRVLNKPLHLIGHNDGEGELNTEEYMLEIKTMNSFAYMNAKKRGVSDSHKYQASVYLEERKIDRVIFMYVNKDNSELMEFPMERKALVKHKDDAYEKINYIGEHVSIKKEPERTCVTPTDKRALGCVYCNLCFGLKS